MSGKRSRAFRAYQKIKTLKPARSLFDLSHELMMTCEMFKLYPVCFMEMSPGDTFHIANQSVTRLQPLNAPILSEIKQNTHYFFVPYRLLWEYWTEFISGGIDGDLGGSVRTEDRDRDNDIDYPTELSPSLPRWIPSNGKNGIGSLWDYFGLPVDVDPKGAYPLDFLRRAYNLIWNEYYRDENLQEEVSLDNEDILYRSWKKDYFTSALLGQQRGVSPAMPVSGTAPISVNSETLSVVSYNDSNGKLEVIFNMPVSGEFNPALANISIATVTIDDFDNNATSVQNVILAYDGLSVAGPRYTGILTLGSTETVQNVSVSLTYAKLSDINFTDSVGFDVKDLRQAFQIQKWLELANRGGVRYTEFLRAFFGVSPRDDRLQRPEYIGGSKSPIVISEVLQTSATDSEPTPQGYMAGHGLGAERTYIGSYSAQEYGIVIGLMSYTTPPLYQQGINRQWLRNTKYDFLFPQFTHLSEQAILGAEVYATDSETENKKVFGFNEIYDELRSIPSLIVGKMRDTFDYWHLARKFTEKPALNSDFISGRDVSKRIFAVQSEDGIICHYANIIRAVRPLPKYGTPGGV